MKSLKTKSNRTYRDAWFSRINWSAHLVPTVKAAVKDFCAELESLDLPKPRLSVLSEQVGAGNFEKQEKVIWADSVHITFGNRIIPAQAIVPVKGRSSLLAEEQAALVLAQFVSGSVMVLLYPPSSEVARPTKQFYIVDMWKNPNSASKKHIVRLLKLAIDADYFCGAANYPNSKGQRILAKLEARDAVLANGGSRIWVWLKYLLRFSRGVLRIHGLWPPVPTGKST